MNLMNKNEYIESLKALVSEVAGNTKGYSINMKADDSREENSGSLSFVFTIKNIVVPKSKEYKIAMYIFENHNTVTCFIINGRTLGLLFENSTMNSPAIALHYLKDILVGEVKWVKELEDTISKQKADARAKRFSERRKPREVRDSRYNNQKNGKGGKVPYRNDKSNNSRGKSSYRNSERSNFNRNGDKTGGRK